MRACSRKLITPRLPPGEDGTPAGRRFHPRRLLTECGVAQTVWATVVAFDDEAFRWDDRPSKLADFFDLSKTYPGQARPQARSLGSSWNGLLLADGVAPDQVYETLGDRRGAARGPSRVLDRHQDQHRVVVETAGRTGRAIARRHAVVMTSVWNGRMYLRTRSWKHGEDFTILWDGQIWDIDSWGIPKGSHNLDKAMDFIRFATGSEPLAEQTEYISYGPGRLSAMALVSDQVAPHLPTAEANMANALQIDAEWWATHHAELSAAFEAGSCRWDGACPARRAERRQPVVAKPPAPRSVGARLRQRLRPAHGNSLEATGTAANLALNRCRGWARA